MTDQESRRVTFLCEMGKSGRLSEDQQREIQNLFNKFGNTKEYNLASSRGEARAISLIPGQGSEEEILSRLTKGNKS